MARGKEHPSTETIGRRDPRFQKALRVKKEAEPRLRQYPNYTGSAVGLKIVDGKRTDQLCIRVFVRKKLPEHLLISESILPRSINGIPVDVVEADFVPQSNKSSGSTR